MIHEEDCLLTRKREENGERVVTRRRKEKQDKVVKSRRVSWASHAGRDETLSNQFGRPKEGGESVERGKSRKGVRREKERRGRARTERQ